MSEASADLQPAKQAPLWLDYALPVLAFSQDLLTTRLPRTDKALPLREELRGYHYTLGTLLFLLAATRLWMWWRGRAPGPSPLLPERAARWAMTLVATTYILFLVNPMLGVLNAWSHGLPVHLGSLPAFPPLVGESRELWLFSGYFHSAVGFGLMLLKVSVLLSALYFLFRYGKGLFAAFPRGFGLYVLLGSASTVYAMTTFKSPEPGPRAVAEFLAVLLVLWGIARIAKRWPGADRSEPWMGRGTIAAVTGAAVVLAFAMYGPYAMFRVSPFATGHVVAAPANVTSHRAPAVIETLPPETDFDRSVKAETFKWCTFCHTMKQGGAHLAGPNLYGIFGQTIATTPNFGYGDALAARGAKGERWTDASLDAFLSNPDTFAPGTAMVISSGNITDPARRAAIIRILKRETGSAR